MPNEEDEYRVDPALEADMLRAIGFVVVEGSFLAESLLSFAQTLAGTPLVADLLASATLGNQVRQVRDLLAAVRVRQHIDAGLADQMRRVLNILDGPLTARRNAVAHGLWGSARMGRDDSGLPRDRIWCDRQTTTGSVEITTTVRSLELIGKAMRVATDALIHTGSIHELSRPRWSEDERQFFAATGYWDPSRALAELEATVIAMDNGTAEGWLWKAETTTNPRADALTTAADQEPDT